MAFHNQRITERELSRLVNRALAHPMTPPALPGMALNYFVFKVPSYVVDRGGLSLAAEACRRELASHSVDGVVADRFVLLAEPSRTTALSLTAHAMGDGELENALQEEAPRSSSGLSVLLPHPGTVLCIRTQWDAELEYDRSFTFGRASDNDLIVKVANTSRRHGQVAYVEGTWKLLDLSSTNGTMLNDTLITGQVDLHPGDVVSVASRTLFTVVSTRDWLRDLIPSASVTSQTVSAYASAAVPTDPTISTDAQEATSSSAPRPRALDDTLPSSRVWRKKETQDQAEHAARPSEPQDSEGAVQPPNEPDPIRPPKTAEAQPSPGPDHSYDVTNPIPERMRPTPALDVNADDLWADYDANRPIENKETS